MIADYRLLTGDGRWKNTHGHILCCQSAIENEQFPCPGGHSRDPRQENSIGRDIQIEIREAVHQNRSERTRARHSKISRPWVTRPDGVPRRRSHRIERQRGPDGKAHQPQFRQQLKVIIVREIVGDER